MSLLLPVDLLFWLVEALIGCFLSSGIGGALCFWLARELENPKSCRILSNLLLDPSFCADNIAAPKRSKNTLVMFIL